jgi:diaminopimelate decarboxylase
MSGAPRSARLDSPHKNEMNSAIWPRRADGEFIVAGKPLSSVVASVGATPCYLYDRRRLDEHVQRLRAQLPARVLLHYAVKANPMPALVCQMAGLVDGLDVASAGEMRVALDSGVTAAQVSFAGPGKTDSELRQAQAAGILINLESFREIEVLATASESTGIAARVAIRVNLPFELKASGMRMSGGAKPFGIDAERVPEMLECIRSRGLDFEGFHLYAGSQNLKAEAIIEAQNRCYELALGWLDQCPTAPRLLNLGGGFGIPYTLRDGALDVDAVIDNLGRLEARACNEMPSARLAIELGRYLVGEAGIYVARILDRKISHDQVFLIVDGGMHHHLAASGNLGQVMRRNYPLAINRKTTAKEIASVTGPLCTPLDLLADRAELDVAEVGDLVVVFQSGAYGRSASPRGFLSHPDVIEALV